MRIFMAPVLSLRHSDREQWHVSALVVTPKTDAPESLAINSPWRKSRIRPGSGAIQSRTLKAHGDGQETDSATGVAGVTTADLPTNDGHPFFEGLNRVLE